MDISNIFKLINITTFSPFFFISAHVFNVLFKDIFTAGQNVFALFSDWIFSALEYNTIRLLEQLKGKQAFYRKECREDLRDKWLKAISANQRHIVGMSSRNKMKNPSVMQGDKLKSC